MLSNLTKITSLYRYKLLSNAYKKWLKEKSSALDIGCGNGIITKLLKEEFGLNIIGCDIKNYLIYNSLPFIEIKSGKLPKINNKFDIALLNDVLHHIPFDEQEELILNALKISKRVLIFEAEPTRTGKLTDILLNKFHYGDLRAPLSFRTVNQWRSLFKKLKLKYSSVKLKRSFWYPFSHIAFMLQKR